MCIVYKSILWSVFHLFLVAIFAVDKYEVVTFSETIFIVIKTEKLSFPV